MIDTNPFKGTLNLFTQRISCAQCKITQSDTCAAGDFFIDWLKLRLLAWCHVQTLWHGYSTIHFIINFFEASVTSIFTENKWFAIVWNIMT